MSVSALDTRTALVVVDLQRGIVSLEVDPPIGPVIENASRLADAFRAAGQPVITVRVTGGAPGRTEAARGAAPVSSRPDDWAEPIPEVHALDGEYVVTKQTWGAFTKTDLDAHLREEGITQVVVCGVATSIGVESTARQAYEHGYNVVVATDAVSDMNNGAHRNSIDRIFPRLGETATTPELIALLGTTG